MCYYPGAETESLSFSLSSYSEPQTLTIILNLGLSDPKHNM